MVISSLSSSSLLGHQHCHPIVVINFFSSWWIMIRRCLSYQQVIMMLIIILLSVPFDSVMSDTNVDKMSFFLTNRHYHNGLRDLAKTTNSRIILMMNDNNNDETRNQNNNNKDAFYLNQIKSLIIPSLISSSSSIRGRQCLLRTRLQSSSNMKQSRSTSMTTMIYTIQRGGDDDDRFSNIFDTEYKDNHPTTFSNSSSSCTYKNDNISTITDLSITSNSNNSTNSSSPHHKKKNENKLLLKMRSVFSLLKMRSVFSF